MPGKRFVSTVLAGLAVLASFGVSAQAQAFIDPTAPPSAQAPVAVAKPKPVSKPRVDRLTLQQILYRQQGAQVVINNRRLGIGDSVLGFTVKNIEPRRVAVVSQGQRFWLDLYPSVIKKS